ncbi:MAG: hypothetical protein JXJ22_10005 [Bacteroidales bacterium]|nr:hypothetical protein [Bacteroidales bacterium]
MKQISRLQYSIVFIFLSFLAISCGNKIPEGLVILTEISSDSPDNIVMDNFPRPRIVAFNLTKSDKPVKELTADFYGAQSPEISYDGRKMLFCAQKNKEDLWQIWEMDLISLEYKQITSGKENCSNPAYLPGGKCVFSKRPENIVTGNEKALYVCNLDGSGMQQITFHPHTDLSSTVLKDGRIVTVSTQLYPEPAKPILMVMRPDGTKAELFYDLPENSKFISRAWETPEGMVFFTETCERDANKGNIIAVNQNRPLFTRMNLSPDTEGSFRYIFPLPSGQCLVSYRTSEKDNYGLYEFDPETKKIKEKVYSTPDYHIVEAVVAVPRERPRNLPSEVDESKKTGLYFCQDINLTNTSSKNNESKKTNRIRLTGIHGSLGKATVENDGSFHLQVIANTPFRIQTINDTGEIVNGPSAWLWIRPNERRGCVGCHQDPELAPDNRLTLSAQKAPVLIPSLETLDDEEHIVE